MSMRKKHAVYSHDLLCRADTILLFASELDLPKDFYKGNERHVLCILDRSCWARGDRAGMLVIV